MEIGKDLNASSNKFVYTDYFGAQACKRTGLSSSAAMMGKKDRFPSKYARFAPQSEGVGRSDHIYSTALTRKQIDLNSASRDGLAVPIQIVPLSKLSSFERENLVLRLTSELEQIRHLQKKVEFQGTKLPNALTVSSSSDILSCTSAQNKASQVSKVKKSVGLGFGHGKKMSAFNRGVKGKAESANQMLDLNPNARLLKQCESLLKKLMSQEYGWVFNTPVDVVKLNLPDYFTIIKVPMDLGTVKSRLASGQYSSPLDFLADVRLTFTNAKTYNPPGTDVHFMADTMSQFFELRWKAIEKKMVVSDNQVIHEKSGICDENETAKPVDSTKKRKFSPMHNEEKQPIKQKMTDEEKRKLGIELEDLLADLPDNIIEFLKAQSSGGNDCAEDEIEIDIDDLCDDTLLTLRKLLNDHLQDKQKNHSKSEACEMELPNVSGPSNSSLQADKEDNDEVDVGGNEAPVTSYPLLQIDKDSGEAHTESASLQELDHHKKSSLSNPHATESTVNEDEESTQPGRQVSPDKGYRAAILMKRFADTILKAQEKTLGPEDKGDPEKVRREREELEMHKKREKARLQAEAKAAEDAQRRAEAEAVAELKRRRELEREAAREALLKIEKTVHINENHCFVEDQSNVGFGDFNFGGSNPLEQLGLYMKMEDDDEDAEPYSIPNALEAAEEGEID